MKVSYFPGCTLKNKAKDLDKYARECAEILGVTMEEVKEWQCCGGVFTSAKDEIATKLSSVRLLKAAAEKEQTLVTVCSACHNVVKQTNYVDGYAVCKSFLVSVPNKTNNVYLYNVTASPKTEMAKFTDITIKKVWDVEEFTEIADNVTVELLRDGIMVKTATLSEMNNWTVTFSDMPESDSYSVVELNIPEGFKASYTQKGYAFTVINCLDSGSGDGSDEDPGADDEDDEDGESGGSGNSPSGGGSGGSGGSTLIQTGQTVWPIPVLAMAGMFLIAVGTIVLRRSRENDG